MSATLLQHPPITSEQRAANLSEANRLLIDATVSDARADIEGGVKPFVRVEGRKLEIVHEGSVHLHIGASIEWDRGYWHVNCRDVTATWDLLGHVWRSSDDCLTKFDLLCVDIVKADEDAMFEIDQYAVLHGARRS